MQEDLVDAYRRLIADVFELAGRSRATSEAIAQQSGQSAARWHVLSVVTDEPHTVPQIARRLGLVRQSVQRVVNDLGDEGLIEFVANPANQRSPTVTITRSGSNLADELFRESEQIRRRTLQRSGLTKSELAQAQHTVSTLAAALDLHE